MKNLTSRQRKFIRAFRTGEQSVADILKSLNLTPHDVAGWMKTRAFRREVDAVGRAFKMVSAWELNRLATHAITASGEMLRDDKSRGSVAMQYLKNIAGQLRRADERKAATPREPLVHPSRAHRAEELMEQMTGDPAGDGMAPSPTGRGTG